MVTESQQSASRNSEVFRQIADQFPSNVPGDDYQFEYSFAVNLDFRDWRRVLVALQAADAVSERGTLTNREEGYLSLLEAHCEILRARVKTPHRNHAVIEWERELAAVEWAIKRARPAER